VWLLCVYVCVCVYACACVCIFIDSPLDSWAAPNIWPTCIYLPMQRPFLCSPIIIYTHQRSMSYTSNHPCIFYIYVCKAKPCARLSITMYTSKDPCIVISKYAKPLPCVHLSIMYIYMKKDPSIVISTYVKRCHVLAYQYTYTHHKIPLLSYLYM